MRFTVWRLVSSHTEGQRRNADHICCSQESSMSRAQSPPVPARKNQLRAEGRQYTVFYRIFTSSSHPKVITELQEVAKTVGKSAVSTLPTRIASCTNYSGPLYRLQQVFTSLNLVVCSFGFCVCDFRCFLMCNLYSRPDGQL